MLAPAKLNLNLHVTGKRADGYHLLQSVVMFAEVGDTLEVTPHDRFELVISGKYATALSHTKTEDNLITRAARLLATHAGVACHAKLHLTKHLPLGAGLGGGSTDAATTLLLLNTHWQLGLSASHLAPIAKQLGSDVPACLHRAPLWMEGVGERINPCEIPFDLPILLANPNVMVPTPSVFAALYPPYDAEMPLPECATLPSLHTFLAHSHNTLERPAYQIAPEITGLLATLSKLPAARHARMSGSGATCFALFDTQDDCEKAASMLQLLHPHYWIISTTLRGSHHG